MTELERLLDLAYNSVLEGEEFIEYILRDVEAIDHLELQKILYKVLETIYDTKTQLRDAGSEVDTFVYEQQEGKKAQEVVELLFGTKPTPQVVVDGIHDLEALTLPDVRGVFAQIVKALKGGRDER